jgi:hypothetical protein
MKRRSLLQLMAAAPVLAASEDDLEFSAMVQPVRRAAVLRDENYYIWCGAPIRSDDGRYHLYYSRWPRALAHNAWVTSSEIAHAVSDRPLGPYRHRDVVFAARGKNYWDGLCTHNPNIFRYGKQYCLFYMGNTGDGKLMKELNYSHRNNQRIGIAIADRPEGPWKRFDRPALDANPVKGSFDSLMTSNPAGCARPEGGVLLVYKGVIDDGSPRGGRVRYGAATAPTPEGPYTRHPGNIFEAGDSEKVWMLAEDPYIWRGKDRYWAITRDVVGRFSGANGGLALFQSRDGFDWQAAAHPKVLGNGFVWEDGAKSGNKVERPALLFEKGKAIALFGAVDVIKDKARDHSFNVHIPLRH